MKRLRNFLSSRPVDQIVTRKSRGLFQLSRISIPIRRIYATTKLNSSARARPSPLRLTGLRKEMYQASDTKPEHIVAVYKFTAGN